MHACFSVLTGKTARSAFSVSCLYILSFTHVSRGCNLNLFVELRVWFLHVWPWVPTYGQAERVH
jgi:hypothetical protein